MKEGFKKALDVWNKFSASDYFIFAVSALILIGWASGLWAYFLCVVAFFCILPLFTGSSNKSLITFLMQFTFIISHQRHNLNAYWWLLFLIVPLVGGVVFQTLRYRKDFAWRLLKPKNFKGQNFFLLLFSVPFLLGGITIRHTKPIVVLLAFCLILLIGLVYTYFLISNYDRQDKKAFPTYMLKNLLAIGLIVSLQMIIFYAKIGSADGIIQTIKLKTHELGWGGPNNIGLIFAFVIPATFYYCVKSKWNPLFVVFGAIEFVLLVSTGSRGATFVVLFALPVLILYVMAVTPYKKSFGITLCLTFFVGAFLLILKADTIVNMLADRLSLGFSGNGRLEFEYPAAWEAFKTYPIFGGGWDYMMGTIIKDGYTPLWFHSSVLQVMAMMGLFGLIIFGIWCFHRYRNFYLLRQDKRVVFLALSTVLFGAYGLIDTGFFSPTFFIMMLALELSVELNLPEDQGRAFPKKWFKEKIFVPDDE